MFQGYTVAPGHPAWQPPAAQRMPSPPSQGARPDGGKAGRPPADLVARVRTKRPASDIEADTEGEGSSGVEEPSPRRKAVAPLPDDRAQPEIELYEEPQPDTPGAEPVSPEQLIADGVASVLKPLSVPDEVAAFEAAWSEVRRCFYALPMAKDPLAKVSVRARFLIDVGAAVTQAWRTMWPIPSPDVAWCMR